MYNIFTYLSAGITTTLSEASNIMQKESKAMGAKEEAEPQEVFDDATADADKEECGECVFPDPTALDAQDCQTPLTCTQGRQH